MIGSAAARYLSKWSDGVVLIGPDEPAGEWAAHEGVFASHYDQGRITRRLDASLTWALWADRSINAYAEIEAESGIRFHYPVGGIQIGDPNGGPESEFNQTKAIALQLGVTYQPYSSEVYREMRPEITLEDGLEVLDEANGAGYINPRSLVAAQVNIAEKQGAEVIRETVKTLEPDHHGVSLTTDGGQTIRAERVLVAAGAWTQFLTGVDLGLVPTPRTIVLARIDQAEADRLREMPTLIFYEGCDHPDVYDLYILPPIRYPDGHTYIKLGGDLRGIDIPHTAAELERWFYGNGSLIEANGLKEVLFRVLPELRTTEIIAKPCVTTHRKEGLPLIAPIMGERVMVAAPGCGAAAKSSNEIGRLAALQLIRS